MKNKNFGYWLGIFFGIVFVLGIYLTALTIFVYHLLFSDQKWIALIALILIFTFSTWRKISFTQAYLKSISPKVDPEDLRKEIAKMMYQSKTYGGPN